MAQAAAEEGEGPPVLTLDNINYSCGSSPTNDGPFHVPWQALKSSDRKVRINYLWKKAYSYAKAASILVRKMIYQNNKIFVDGYTQKKNLKTISQFD